MAPERSSELFKIKPGSVSDRRRLTLDLRSILVSGSNLPAARGLTQSMTVCLSDGRLLFSFRNIYSQSPVGLLVSKKPALDEDQRKILCLGPQWFLEYAQGIPQGIIVSANHHETLIYYILND